MRINKITNPVSNFLKRHLKNASIYVRFFFAIVGILLIISSFPIAGYVLFYKCWYLSIVALLDAAKAFPNFESASVAWALVKLIAGSIFAGASAITSMIVGAIIIAISTE